VPADAGKVIRASKLRSSTKWGLGSAVLREIYSLSKVLQHPAGDQGRLALYDVRSSGFPCAAVAPFSPECQPSRGRTSIKKGKLCAKQEANRFDL